MSHRPPRRGHHRRTARSLPPRTPRCAGPPSHRTGSLSQSVAKPSRTHHALSQIAQRRRKRPPHLLAGPPGCHVDPGGSVVPPRSRCRLQGRCRNQPVRRRNPPAICDIGTVSRDNLLLFCYTAPNERDIGDQVRDEPPTIRDIKQRLRDAFVTHCDVPGYICDDGRFRGLRGSVPPNVAQIVRDIRTLRADLLGTLRDVSATSYVPAKDFRYIRQVARDTARARLHGESVLCDIVQGVCDVLTLREAVGQDGAGVAAVHPVQTCGGGVVRALASAPPSPSQPKLVPSAV